MNNTMITICAYVSIIVFGFIVLMIIILYDLYSKHINSTGVKSDSNYVTIMDYKEAYKQYLSLVDEYVMNYKFDKVHYADDNLQYYFINIYKNGRIFMKIEGPYFCIVDQNLSPRECKIRFRSFISYFRYLILFNKCKNRLLKFVTKKSCYISNNELSAMISDNNLNWERK